MKCHETERSFSAAGAGQQSLPAFHPATACQEFLFVAAVRAGQLCRLYPDHPVVGAGDAVEEIGGYYHATGSFSPLSGDPDEHDITACLELLEGSDLVDFVDVRRYGTYTMDDYLTADTVGIFSSPSIAAWYVQGTVNNIEIQEGNFSHILVSSPSPTFNFTEKSIQNFSYQLTGTLSN